MSTRAGSTLIGARLLALITIGPLVVSRRHAPGMPLGVFGRAFTVWGIAGLAGPWLASVIIDANASYTWAFLVAATSIALAVFPSRFCLGSRQTQ